MGERPQTCHLMASFRHPCLAACTMAHRRFSNPWGSEVESGYVPRKTDGRPQDCQGAGADRLDVTSVPTAQRQSGGQSASTVNPQRKGRMMGRGALLVIGILLAAGCATVPGVVTDPGVRGGPAGAGAPLPGLTSEELVFF